MKNQLWILFSAMMVVGSCAYAVESEDDAGDAGSSFYGEIGIGTFAFSENSGYSIDNSKSRLVTLGWEHKLGDKGASAAIEYTHSFQANSNDSISYDPLSISSQYDFKTDALYGAYRTSGPLYFKLKGGFIHSVRSCQSPGFGSSCDGGNDPALGFGFGLRGEVAFIEAEIMKMQNFSSASIGVGMHF